ncbi:MAG TPA: hypothetical protein VLI04_16125 [Nocardioidaceae bacterium]|nr:hypothetical protein [Nocardioidaceae bacterium]
MTRSRLLLPLAAALAVLVLVGGIWWATAGTGDEPEASPAASLGDTYTDPDPGPDPGKPDDGGGAPGNPGSVDPGAPDPSPAPEPDPVDDPGSPAPGSIGIDSYVLRAPDVLALNYTIGVPQCYGQVTDVIVKETDEEVYVQLVHEAAKSNGDLACIDLALLKSINVELGAPLGDRVVKDAAFTDKKVDRTDTPYAG